MEAAEGFKETRSQARGVASEMRECRLHPPKAASILRKDRVREREGIGYAPSLFFFLW